MENFPSSEFLPKPSVDHEAIANEQPLDVVSSVLNPGLSEVTDNGSWIKRNWKGVVGGSAFVAAAAISVSQFSKVEHAIEKDAPAAIPAFAVTEGAAWGGAALILASNGKKIGNPLTVKKRLNEIKSNLERNKLYKTGLTINILGAIGTSTVLTAGAVTSAPESSWPLAFGVAAASLGFSGIPWVWANRSSGAKGEAVIIENTVATGFEENTKDNLE